MTVQKRYQASLNKQHGFSLFEMVVVVLLIGVLVSIAIDRLLLLQIEAERVSVRHVIGALESAVYIQTAEIVLKQGLAAMSKLENTNPMNYLGEQPYNYRGVKTADESRKVPAANWYFDAENDELVYKVKNKKYFVSEKQHEARIRLKLSLLYREGNETDESSAIQGVRLEKLHEYSWKLPE